MRESFELVLVRPRGFCAGVERAIDIVDIALERVGAPIYVRREIVHNQAVVERFRSRGVIFVEELDEVPNDSLCIFSAHGVAPSVFDEARARGLQVIDATCPLVTKVHLEVQRGVSAGDTIVLIGHAGHDEVLGTMGQAPDRTVLVESAEQARALEVEDPDRLYYVTQTTLSVDETREVVDALRERFPAIRGPRKDDICYATQNRQDAVKALVGREDIELLLVVGSTNSSNSQRLVEVAHEHGAAGHLVDGPADIDPQWLVGLQRVGVSAGASAPEDLVQGVVARLVALGGEIRELTVVDESVSFPLPTELSELSPQNRP